MKKRALGRSGIEASVIAFGAWAIGGWTWGGADENESIRAIHAFLDAGGDLIDTAPIYGFGASEEVVGKAIADRRDKVVLATKCSMRWDLSDQQKERAKKKFSTTQQNVDWTGEKQEQSFDVFIYSGRDGIREEVERSLKRLQTDVIDLYQTHWQDDATPIEERMGALEELKQEGKIRAIGVSNASREQIDQYRQFGQVDTDQEKYSMLDRGMETANLPKCADEQIAFLAYSPLGQGLLTGKITPEREYDEGDQRRFKDRFKPENVRKVQAMLEPMLPIAERHQVSLAQLTMAWTLAQPGCSHVLCGARNPQQAIDNAGAGDVELTSEEIAEISSAVQSYSGV
ncbi:aldo/keto reductase [Blastopirellula marina]|uniref:Putative aldoketo reductase protein n=1 Tax=Blastopirellula marina DSM 3645 TaxID=314230 RepID=A3ZNE9_9BACT|nr:aldo/keto reductase [Blastopirellula marina]EAQ81844.1 putative aldoketo reductase protein [Blastopirellula marina DSM 3645]